MAPRRVRAFVAIRVGQGHPGGIFPLSLFLPPLPGGTWKKGDGDSPLGRYGTGRGWESGSNCVNSQVINN